MEMIALHARPILDFQFYKSNFTSPILQVQFYNSNFTSPILQALLAQPHSKCLLLFFSGPPSAVAQSIGSGKLGPHMRAPLHKSRAEKKDALPNSVS
jgi:hypothetical protein